jgi:hypothetical protein
MQSRVLFAGALALLAATVSCVAGGNDDEATDDSLPDIPLDLIIDRVDIAHGALRLSARMREGSADVSVLAGEACGSGDIGRGVSTRSTLVWFLAEDEIAKALKCGLVVHARVVAEKGVRVVKSVFLSVSPDVASSGAEEGPQVEGTVSSTADVRVAFASGELTLSHLDFARSMLSRSPVVFGRSSFDTSLSVAGVELEVEPTEPPSPEVEAPEIESTEPVEGDESN